MKRLSSTDQNNTSLYNLPAPTLDHHAATKLYVDTGLSSKQASSTALTNLLAVTTAGSLHRTGTDTYASRTLTGTTNLITVTNGTGAAGNPTFTVGASVLRTDTAQTIAGVKTFSATPIISTLTGYIKGNGASALTAASTIPIADISATGTASATTYLRGDGTWSTPTSTAPSNMMTTDSAQTITSAGVKTFQAGALIMTSALGTGQPYSDANPPQTLNMEDQVTTPVNPPTGQSTLYTSNGKVLHLRASDGTEITFSDTTSVTFVRVVHGANASIARPNVTHVEWVGSVAPTNGTTADTWIDTA